MRIKRTILGIIAAILLLGAAGSAARAAAATPKGKSAAKAASRKKHTVKRTRVRRRRRRRVRRIRGQRRPTHDRVVQIQRALADAGAYHGKIDGVWGKASSQAMMEFQSAHGLKPTGKINARTLQKLGLGSQVAGLGAPVPPVTTGQDSDQQSP